MNNFEEGPAKLKLGSIIGRFVLTSKIGEGACGAVYGCKEIGTGKQAALKAELLSDYGNGLKLEVQILKRLHGKAHVAQVFSCGKNNIYCYMVITLLGKSLSQYMHQYKLNFTLSTIIRVAIQTLFALKQIHEIGIVHRDMKPANMAVGRNGIHKKIIHVIDFGLSRDFTITDEDGKLRIRRPRKRCLFRGTVKYCSIRSLEKKEQGRGDDLVSLFYICSEFYQRLPWSKAPDKETVLNIKKKLPDDELFPNCTELAQLLKYAKSLNYEDRPDYLFMFTKLRDAMKRGNYTYSDPYDWEIFEKNLLQKRVESQKITALSETQRIDDVSFNGDNKTKMLSINKYFENHLSQDKFETNEIGF
ncbi:Asator [Strongyloides ratti]|uniref:Asator n=1 Tax=Strongyloides ratti TaxID=34506 RepID=A0A090LGZ1_STRRB|nr:Asator [Strongyloides ratti]CEF69052.1 Asator [Strongyloides ratti]